MSKKSADQIIYGSDFSFSLAILRRSMGAGETKDHTIVLTK